MAEDRLERRPVDALCDAVAGLDDEGRDRLLALIGLAYQATGRTDEAQPETLRATERVITAGISTATPEFRETCSEIQAALVESKSAEQRLNAKRAQAALFDNGRRTQAAPEREPSHESSISPLGAFAMRLSDPQ